MPLNTGRMDRLITVLAHTVARNAFGEPISTWSELDDVWARWEQTGGRELIASMARFAGVDARVTIRFRSDVTVANRIVYDSTVWEIVNRTEIGRREGLELIVKRTREPIPSTDSSAFVTEEGVALVTEEGGAFASE
jgi:SPP1 family predicted phage head-tail adaptor